MLINIGKMIDLFLDTKNVVSFPNCLFKKVVSVLNFIEVQIITLQYLSSYSGTFFIIKIL